MLPARPDTPTVVSLDVLDVGGVARFEGSLDGGPARPATSLFVVRTPPGRGAATHVHPYPEVFVLLEGDAEYEIGPVTVRPGPGSVVVAPAGVPHRYRNVGDAPLLQVSVHPAGAVTQHVVPAAGDDPPPLPRTPTGEMPVGPRSASPTTDEPPRPAPPAATQGDPRCPA